MKITQAAFMTGPVLVILALVVSCRDNGTGGPWPPPPGSHSYVAFDSLGAMVARGTFTFSNEDSSHFGGSWQCGSVGAQKDIGPQTGSGTLSGTRRDSTMMINLNPYIVDNNVFLTGTRARGIITGDWVWSGYPGVLNKGRFVLE